MKRTAPATPRLLMVVNVDWFFLSHRAPIAREALRAGYEVHLACTVTDRLDELKALGIVVHPLNIGRSDTHPLGALRVIGQCIRLFCSLRPDIVHLVTIKPVLLGGIAARIARVPAVVAAVSGLGFVFIADGIGARLRRMLVALLYRVALSHRHIRVIFQNPDDRAHVRALTGLPERETVLIAGSGVDLERYRAYPLAEGTPLVVLAARLLADKGIREFVQAVRQLRSRTPALAARYALVGNPDPENPSSISLAELDGWRREGIVELWGHRDDMPQVLSAAHIVVLPSYREGMPKILLEAAACARAVITTDTPGCRDAIEADRTGLLVPARDARALADAIERLLTDTEGCRRMGEAGRALAERKFDVRLSVADHLRVYRELQEARQ